MNLDLVLSKLDEYQRSGRNEEAEEWLLSNAAAAAAEGDSASLLSLLNELMGHYRELSRVEESFTMAEQAIALAEKLGLQEELPYATTVLNAANAYRAGGALRESEECYLKVRALYDKLLPDNSLLKASMENNLALLYQEQGQFKQAKVALLKALKVVEAGTDTEFEIGVTYANLASTCLALDEDEECFEYSDRAIEWFDKINLRDSHYAAAIAAKAMYFMKRGEYRFALNRFRLSMEIMEKMLGRNDYYDRLSEYASECERQVLASEPASAKEKGMDICRKYYENFGAEMIEKNFAEYSDRIAVALLGEGSDCLGFDDVLSRDHDWGPGFGLFVTAKTYSEIGERLEQAYNELPAEFMGYKRVATREGKQRTGVIVIDDYIRRLSGAVSYSLVDWKMVSDASLAALVSGEIFRDEEGILTSKINEFKAGFPENVRLLKIAEAAAEFSQNLQYNYPRMTDRGDELTAKMHLAMGVKAAMRLQLLAEGRYPLHLKWLSRQTEQTEGGRELVSELEKVMGGSTEATERAANMLAMKLYAYGFISDTDNYLANAVEELLIKSKLSEKSEMELAEEIARLEFKAFDRVKNEGGRASCQDDWGTFSIMRKSQYLTWNKTMLIQYYYDFERELSLGHNLIEEKYGRMMESTAPDKYEEIKDAFPQLTEEKMRIIETIVSIQVSWMEAFRDKYPRLSANARRIYTSEDSPFETSYETYLRGELGTYSDKMLELYGRFISQLASTGGNLAEATMYQSARLYGYESLEAAENSRAEKGPACTIQY